MIERDGDEWGSPREVGEQLGVRDTCVRDWVRDGLLSGPDEVRRYGRNGRFLAVRLTAAARVAKRTENVGRHRTPLDTPPSPLDIPC